MTSPAIHPGGCLCGRIRYEVRGNALQTSLCHCEDCRRASGAPFVAWTFFLAEAVTYIQGTPKSFLFARRQRFFCGDCGTPLQFHDTDDERFCEINTCSFDNPSVFPPSDQCWVNDEIPWIHQIEKLPRFDVTSPLPGET